MSDIKQTEDIFLKLIESTKNIKDALKLLKSYDITEVAICSVVPDITKIFVNEIKNL